MRLTDGVHLVGSGAIRLSNRYDCHVYLLESEGEAALIDGGSGLDPECILRNVAAAGVAVSAIRYLLLTHAHGDHAGGVKVLQERLRLKVVASETEARLLATGSDQELGLDLARSAGIYPPDFQIPRTSVDQIVADGETLRVGAFTVTAMVRPGHSAGHTCYLAAGERQLLFGGDIVFLKGLASVQNIPGCDIGQYRSSVLSLRGLGVDGLFPGHSLWCVDGAQEHIDLAATRWSGTSVPSNYT